MAHDVFVSYSTKDKPVADAVVAGLESQGIRCWIAPRDVTPGTSWGDAIVNAIGASRIMVVVLSENSNHSRQVIREVERAVANEVIIIPFRIENIDPTGAMAYFLSTEHWLDALTPPLERHIEKLQTTIQLFLSGGDRSVLKEQLSQPAAPPSAPSPRWRSMPIPAILLTLIIMVAVGMVVIPRWLGEAPSAASTDTAPPTTSTLTPTPTPTLTPTPPPTFHLVGNWPTSREARNVFVQGNTAYIANGEDGLIILNVSDPSDPEKLGSYPLENAQNVVVADHIAYVTEQGQVSDGRAQSDKLVLIDVIIPSTPRLLGEYTPESGYTHRTLNNLAVAGQMVYFTKSDGLIVVDVSNPSALVTIGEFSFSSNISSPGVDVVNDIAYVQANELHVIDVSNPAEPVEIGGFDPGWGASITVTNQTAYIAGWDTGLTILDVSNPAQPIKLGQFKELVGNYELLPPGASNRQTILDVSVSDNIAYLTYNFGIDQGTWTQTLESGVIAVDISDPGAPGRLDVYSELDGVSSVFAAGDLVFVTDSTRGLFVLSKPH
jgi:hypothetical protein